MMNVTKGTTIAYVKTKAISAGALIALSCRKLVMKKGTTIGDCAPLLYTNEGPQMLGEKFQSPIRAKFRALAKRNNYPEALAEAMVSDNMVVYKIVTADSTMYLDSVEYADMPQDQKKGIVSKATVVSRGKLLTLNDDEAADLGFSQMSVESLDEYLKKANYGNYEVINLTQNWSEEFARFISKIAPILMMIGFAALYIEFKTPGFGAPGVIGIICLALVFLAQYMVGLAHYTELLLVILGVVMIGLEIFVFPGLLIAGIAGALCIATGLLLSLQGFVVPKPEFPWQQGLLVRNMIEVFGSLLAAGVLSISFLKYVFPRIGMVVKGPYLTETLISSHADSEEIRNVNIGDTGTALTLLRPSGKARLGTETYDVMAMGEFIERGCEIKVIDVSRSKITVSRK
jgi:membrane-bound serine protease (ClpP class)